MDNNSGGVTAASLDQEAANNNNNNNDTRSDPYLEIELYLKKVNDEIGAVFEQWQKEAAQKQRYPDVVKSEGGGDAPLADGPTLKVAPQLTPPSCSSPPAKAAPKVPPKRPTLLLPDLLPQHQQDPAATATTAAKTPTSPLEPKEVDSFLRKVQNTILGDSSPVLDAGTQTPLSRSSSVAWLSSSQSSLGGGSAGAETSSSPFSSSEDTFHSSNEPNRNAAESSSPERESCDSSSRGGSAGDLLDNWDGSRPPVSGREGTPSWRSATSDNETRVKRRPKPKPCESLHSPSSVTSLSGHVMCPEMGTKSSSAPVLMKELPESPKSGHTTPNKDQMQRNYPQMRSHSERHLGEIEAAEACRWMRAAGFPQYAQMYADHQFPVDLHAVQKDHPFLDRDALQALFRRLHALNKCARLQRIDGPSAATLAAHHHNERRDGLAAADSDEEVECALSDNWMFLHQSRRWSRVSPLTEQQSPLHRAVAPQAALDTTDLPECDTKGADDLSDLTRVQNQLPLQRQHSSSLPPEMESEFASPQPFRRSGSEKLRDGAKAFLRRVESLKSRGKKAKVGCRSEDMPKIGSPQVIDVESMQERMRNLNCVDLNSPEALEAGSPHPTTMFTNANNNLLFPEKDDLGAHSDSECLDRSSAWMDSEEKNKEEEKVKKKKEPTKRARKLQTKDQRSATLNLDIKIKPNKASSKFGKSDNGGLANMSPDKEESSRTSSFYEQLRRGAFAKRHKEMSKGSSEGSIHEDDAFPSPSKKTVTRWHSFGRGSAMRRPSTLTQVGSRRKGVPLASLSCGQLMVLRQLAMLKLTAMMEKHCPSLRSTGFSWELPKFMRKTGKTSHPKDGALFGVSLIASLQYTGQALPKPIQAAIKHLSEHALDRVGIFRKPGVKSRIQKLRQQIANLGTDEPFELALEEQQDYDVADLVKQFFRELPEALMTTKLSDTFLAVFQHVPLINRHEAMKWAVILLPDQHREVLQLLLSFLSLVSAHARHNQMTSSNLAVCFAPSLFHSGGSLPSTPSGSLDSPDLRGAGLGAAGGSPRTRSSKRAKGSGSPDARELSESRAGHDCLLYLINHHEELVRVSQELLVQCHFSSMEQSVPLQLDELGADTGHDWKAYMAACTSALLKEVKERSRGWVTVSSQHQQVELAYKKVGDGHPLRVWRATTEVEAPPAEVLNRILRDQFMWDPTLARSRVLARLDANTEVFQFAANGMPPLVPRDFCVLRTWRSDLPRGGCVLVETSVEFGLSTEPLVPGAIRGIVLASRYLIEHCGSGRSRVVHLSRVDTKGRSVEWYNKCYGQMSALRLSRVRSSFTQYLSSEGPESKV